MTDMHAANGPLVEVAGTDLNFKPLTVADRSPSGRQILAYCDLAPHSEHVVLQWLPGGDIEEVRPEESVDFSGAGAPRLIVARADRTFRLTLDDRSLEWPMDSISEGALRTLGAIEGNYTVFLRKEDRPDAHVRPGSTVKLGPAGVETFYSRAAKWKLNVQGVVIESDTPTIAVRDALTRAGFAADGSWIIVLKTSSERRQIELDDTIDLTLPGIEKLRLTPLEINNGASRARPREFALLPTDETGLQERRVDWSAVVDQGRRWLLLHDVALPEGYNTPTATIAVEVPTSYPMAEIDMFYCQPALSRADGRPIPQTEVTQAIAGDTFQRWSRHRGAGSQWRPGNDNVLTHLTLVDASIAREVEQ